MDALWDCLLKKRVCGEGCVNQGKGGDVDEMRRVP